MARTQDRTETTTRGNGGVTGGALAPPAVDPHSSQPRGTSASRARHSVLFPPDAVASHLRAHAPPFFPDLNLDQVVVALTRGREEYELAPLFYTLPRAVETVAYRQAALRDLERAETLAVVRAFAETMRTVRAHLRQAGRLHYRWQKRRWFLEAVWTYAAPTPPSR